MAATGQALGGVAHKPEQKAVHRQTYSQEKKAWSQPGQLTMVKCSSLLLSASSILLPELGLFADLLSMETCSPLELVLWMVCLVVQAIPFEVQVAVSMAEGGGPCASYISERWRHLHRWCFLPWRWPLDWKSSGRPRNLLFASLLTEEEPRACLLCSKTKLFGRNLGDTLTCFKALVRRSLKDTCSGMSFFCVLPKWPQHSYLLKLLHANFARFEAHFSFLCLFLFIPCPGRRNTSFFSSECFQPAFQFRERAFSSQCRACSYLAGSWFPAHSCQDPDAILCLH